MVGYEIAIRAGRCWHDDHWNYQSCGSWGSLACAAVAARLHGLSHEQTRHALGIADYHAPNAPMMCDVRNPSMVKHATGWGALNGVISAELARRGFTGIPSLLGFDAYREWILDLGEHYWMADWVFYKGWASCAWGHAACQAALELVKKHHISVQQITHLRVRTFEEAVLLHQEYPATTEEAQFSVKWPLACLLLDGSIGPDQILEHRFSDPAVRTLFDKIELVLDPAIDAMYKQAQEMDLRMHSAVEVTLQDGRRFDSGIVERGADRWDQAMLEDKFRWLLGHVLPDGSPVIEQVIELLQSFENVGHVHELTRLLKQKAA